MTGHGDASIATEQSSATWNADRKAATAKAWLSRQPQITIVARDRGGAYARAAARALPNAVQVAECWHLMTNASHAVLDPVRKSMRHIRSAVLSMTINPAPLSAARRLQFDGYLRREEANAAVLTANKEGLPIKEIVLRTGYSRNLVRQIIRGQRNVVFRLRESSLEGYLPSLDAEWSAGQRNGAELWRRLRSQGFRDALRVVTKWATGRRRADQINADTQPHSIGQNHKSNDDDSRDTLTKAETVTGATVEPCAPALIEAREIVAAFRLLIRRKTKGDLSNWIEQPK